jgi:hypothetical protein
MADLNLGAQQIVLNAVQSDLAGFTHDDVSVTWTATMKNGSILGSAGTELAIAGAAGAVGVIDDLHVRDYGKDLQVGDVLTVAVAKHGVVFKEANIVFTDGAIDAAGKTALAAQLNQFA